MSEDNVVQLFHDVQRDALDMERRLKSGGGDGTSSDMEGRVAALENGIKSMSAKLDKLVDGSQKAALDMAEIKGRLNGFEGKVEGRLDGLSNRISATPTAIQLVVMMMSTWAAGAAIVWAVSRAMS